MELKVGQTIYAIDVCLMDTNEESLTIGKGYEIKKSNKDTITIIDDVGDDHEYDKTCDSIDYFGLFFTTEPPKTERYFIVFYDGNTDIGYCECITTDGQYVSQTQARTAIKEHVGHENHSITNIIELNQQDYESWNK